MVEMLYIRLTLLFILTIQDFYVSAYYGRAQSGPACDPADPVPPRRLSDPRLIKGAWISRFVKLSRALPLEFLYPNFKIFVGEPFENGSIPLEQTFRFQFTCNKCENKLDVLVPTGKRNTFTLLKPGGTSGIVWDWQFVDFFGDYLLTLQCLKLDDNERCLNSFLTVYARTSDPISLADRKRINQSLRKTLCVDFFEDFHQQARSGEDCPAIHI